MKKIIFGIVLLIGVYGCEHNMASEHDCYNEGKRHKFVARYSEKPMPGNFETKGYSAEQVREMDRYKIYIWDICEWCGKTNKANN